MSQIKGIYTREVVKPMRVVFATSLGSKDFIKSIIVRVSLDNGIYGEGECPTSFVLKHEDTVNIKGVIKDAATQLLGTKIEDFTVNIRHIRSKFHDYPLSISGLEVALFRAYLANTGVTEHKYWGGKTKKIETDITIPFIPQKESLEKWMRYTLNQGFTIYKIKVSGDIETDIRFISAINHILSSKLDEFSVRLDGNQGFTEKSFLKILNSIEKMGLKIQLFEQPLQKNDYKGLKNIMKRTSIPIILDETIFTVDDLRHAISENLCDGINIKIAKSGIFESYELISIAKKNRLKIMIGCMTETMTGLSAAIYMAAGTDSFDFIDLDSIYYLHHRHTYRDIQLVAPSFIINTN